MLNSNTSTILKILVDRVKELIDRYRCDCILLSAGIDTSFIATVAVAEAKHDLLGVLTAYHRGVPKDMAWAIHVSKVLGIDLNIHIFDDYEALEATDLVISTLKTFDPMEVRNDITIAISLKKAKDLGCRCVYTGDAGDELFAGYSYMRLKTYNELERYIKDLASYMEFSSNILDKVIGVRVVSPFNHKEIRDLALKIPQYCRIPIDDPRRLNKYILRAFLEEMNIPTYIREKNPIEYGSSSSEVVNLWISMIDDRSIVDISKYFKPRSREQAYLLKRYIEIVGWEDYSDLENKYIKCKYCGAPIRNPRSRYCRRCGSYPAV